MSPEIFSGNESIFYGFEVDMWAFGVLFYFMLNMEFPFSTYHSTQSSIPTGRQSERKLSSRN
jgi:serine/threonine protein kinase